MTPSSSSIQAHQGFLKPTCLWLILLSPLKVLQQAIKAFRQQTTQTTMMHPNSGTLCTLATPLSLSMLPCSSLQSRKPNICTSLTLACCQTLMPICPALKHGRNCLPTWPVRPPILRRKYACFMSQTICQSLQKSHCVTYVLGGKSMILHALHYISSSMIRS